MTRCLPWAWSDSIAGLEKAAVIVLLGTDTYNRQPIVDLRIRRAIRKGARVYVVTPEPARLDRLAARCDEVMVAGQSMGGAVALHLAATGLRGGAARLGSRSPGPRRRGRGDRQRELVEHARARARRSGGRLRARRADRRARRPRRGDARSGTHRGCHPGSYTPLTLPTNYSV